MAAQAQGAPTAHSRPFIRFRLSHIDSVSSRDNEEHDVRESPFLPEGEKLASVPVIRIFGATDKGQRVVAHVHGAFPYVYIAYKGKLDPDSGELAGGLGGDQGRVGADAELPQSTRTSRA